MSNPYREIFRIPGSFAFSLSGLIARAPLAMNTLSIVTMISMESGRYALASAVATTYAVCNALLAPQLSKLADRCGQTRAAVPATFIALCAMLLLIAAARAGAPAFLLFICAALMGFMPSFGAFVRARWARLFHGSFRLHTAFAYESTIDETIFMVGPILVIYLSTSFFPGAGLLGSAVLLAFGAALFCLQKATEPPIIGRPEGRQKGRSVIFNPAIAAIVSILLAIGAIFGTAEVTAVAFAKQQGSPAASMWPLAAYAFGSFLVGLIYGSIKVKTALMRQFIIAVSLVALTTLPLLWAGSIAGLTFILLIAGCACSPSIIIAMRQAERLTPSAQLTEGMTWAMTGLSIGLAAGIASSGQLIDRFGAISGFYATVFFGLATLALLLSCRRLMERAKAAETGSV